MITLLLSGFAIIPIVMSCYDDTSADADVYATAIKTGSFNPPFSSKIGAIIAVLAIAGIAWLILRKR